MKILMCLMVLMSKIALACSCGPSILTVNYASADFVAYIKVKNIIPNQPDSKHYYKIQIEPIAVFKGKLTKELYVYGSLDGSNWTSCDLKISQDTKWIVYARPNAQSQLAVYMCNGSWQTDVTIDTVKYPTLKAKYATRLSRELDILSVLKNKASKFTYSYSMHNPKMADFLKLYEGKNYQNSFGQYLITFDVNTTAKSVKVLKSLNKGFDKELANFIVQSNWKVLYNKKVPNNGKYLLGIYQYEENAKHFLSIFSL